MIKSPRRARAIAIAQARTDAVLLSLKIAAVAICAVAALIALPSLRLF